MPGNYNALLAVSYNLCLSGESDYLPTLDKATENQQDDAGYDIRLCFLLSLAQRKIIAQGELALLADFCLMQTKHSFYFYQFGDPSG